MQGTQVQEVTNEAIKHVIIIHNEKLPDQLQDCWGVYTGRLDMLARTLNGAIFLSHKTRRDIMVWICFEEHQKSIGIHGDHIRHLRPNETSITTLLKKAFYWEDDERCTSGEELPKEKKCLRGMYWLNGGWEKLMEFYATLPSPVPDWFYLTETGIDLLSHPAFQNCQSRDSRCAIIVGDPNGLTPSQEEWITSRPDDIHAVALGRTPLLASHCIVIFLYLLENHISGSPTK